jgi:hypothetical protein
MDLKSLVELAPAYQLPFEFAQMTSTSSSVLLSNKSKVYIEFRVKLPHFNLYTVTPVHGILKPGEQVPIKFILRPVKDLGSTVHMFEFVFVPRCNSKLPSFSHKLKADFGTSVTSQQSSQKEKYGSHATEGAMDITEEVVLEDDEGTEEFTCYDEGLTRRSGQKAYGSQATEGDEAVVEESVVLEEVEVTKATDSFDDNLTKLKEELSEVQSRLKSPRAGVVKDTREDCSQLMLLVFFCIGLFLGSYALT